VQRPLRLISCGCVKAQFPFHKRRFRKGNGEASDYYYAAGYYPLKRYKHTLLAHTSYHAFASSSHREIRAQGRSEVSEWVCLFWSSRHDAGIRGCMSSWALLHTGIMYHEAIDAEREGNMDGNCCCFCFFDLN